MNLDPTPALRFVDNFWEDRILPTLRDYIGIPNQSPCFDADWEDKGYMDDAMGLVKAWCEKQAPRNVEVTLHTCAGRTPLLLVDIPGRLPGQALLYGHLDKQPSGSGWREGLSAWSPVREGDLLYGRGAADDGYAVFACIGAITLLETQGIPFPRCVLLIECSEESGSQDLAYYLDRLQDRIGTPDLVVCLDSGCGNYEQLWVTTSLRGLIGGNLTVEVLREGVHSGDASGVVPSSFRIIRALLDRIEDPETGEVVEAFQVPVPPCILEQIRRAVDALGTDHFRRLPVSGELSLVGANTFENVVNRTWCPALEITGAGDLPPLDAAGNVLRPRTSIKLSLRLPPTLDTTRAGATLARILQTDPPYGARVGYEEKQGADGWQAPPFSGWLDAAVQEASTTFFNRPAIYSGEGFSIPFMPALVQAFPATQFIVTGVLGPDSNAHGPNEFLHLGMAKKLTACVGEIVSRLTPARAETDE